MYQRPRLLLLPRLVFKPSHRHASTRNPVASSIPARTTPKSPPPVKHTPTNSSVPTPPTWGYTRIALSLLNLFLVTHLITTYVITIRPCTGPSMLPTIAWDGDYVLLSKLHRYGRFGVGVGDLVSYEHPVRQGWKGIKRIVGMPGDFVLRDTPRETYGVHEEDAGVKLSEQWMVQVPDGHCWIVGDNLPASRDSRHFGPLPLALVRGKVVARVWPRPAWFENGPQMPEP